MEEKIEKPKPWYHFLGNKFFLTALLFVVWMLFLDNYCYFNAQKDLNKQLNDLENQKKYYKNEILNDKKNIEELKNPDLIEKFAREKYFMKKDSEDVFVVEFEGDTIKK
jgi:cell division protein DivIC